ncbi:MAG: hypothetical protein IH806_10860, partial [Proteobacteria bacterium]|nr:hypothetical protein [Pseudomonadota bacterium]
KLRGVNIWPEAVGEIACELPGMTQDYFVRAVREATRKPIFAKLSPNVTRIDEIAAAAERGGADGVTVKNAILALVTKSANDAAVVVAEALAGKETKFARLMTAKARELGMKRTSFRNASGLPNRRQMSTARDMATLARALIRDFPKKYAYFSTKQFIYKGRKHRNHNRLLKSYSGTDGLKTGYIRASGFNLVAWIFPLVGVSAALAAGVLVLRSMSVSRLPQPVTGLPLDQNLQPYLDMVDQQLDLSDDPAVENTGEDASDSAADDVGLEREGKPENDG